MATSINALSTNSAAFVELLGRSNFSFLQGSSHPEEMVLQAKRYGYQGIALCDLNGLYGIVRGWQAAHKNSSFTAEEFSHSHRNFRFFSGAELQLDDKSSLTLLPINKNGYHNLCQLITEAKRSAEKGYSKLNLDSIIAHSDDLLAFYLPPWNEKRLQLLQDIFYDRLYLPVWKDLTWQSMELYNQALALESKWGVELFATQRPFMHHPNRKQLHDVLTCILHKTSLNKAKSRLLQNSERHLKPLSELALLWQERPDLLSKTVTIAQRIEFSLEELKYQYPSIHMPQEYNSTDYLKKLTYEGLAVRYPFGIPEKIHGLVKKELDLICELNYEDYFLTLWDICKFARKKNILHQGRGSAANSAVCYALGLTAVNPDSFQLMFERFISKERGEPPDIDIDFESGRREEVIQYIYKKYGKHHAAMVCTVICYRTKMALRDCAKTLEIPEVIISNMIKFMGREGFKKLLASPDMAESWGISSKQFTLLLELVEKLISFPRHLGIHTGGFLIAQRPIFECVPIEKATMDKRYVIQWNKDDLCALRMMKIDVLGLGMLTALQKCFNLLKEKKQVSMDLRSVPSEDKPTYDMIQRAETIGVFQIESRAQMGLLPRLKPKNFYDLVVEVAIVRPGPIQGGMVHPYIRRRNGEEPIHYAHPDLKPILQKTFGVPIFQEQLMQMASTVCGFTPGEADELRRIMSSSWQKKGLMEGLRKRLINGMLSHGINMSYAEQIYKTIVGFASYGFPESHAASFALLTYASCYLKHHHPDAFVCSLLNSQPMGFYAPRMLIAEAQRNHVKFLNLDIQKSNYDYTLESSENKTLHPVRVGFRAIHGLKEKHIQHLIKERNEYGPFQSLKDLTQRINLAKPLLMSLGAAGAFECLGLPPRKAMWHIQSLNLDQNSLFYGKSSEGLLDSDSPIKSYQKIPKESSWEKLSREYHWQGYSIESHPLKILRPAISYWSDYDKRHNGAGFTCAKNIKKLPHGSYVRVAGLLSLTQKPPTAKGFAFLTLEDETGTFNIILLPDIYQKYRLVVASNPLLEIFGQLESAQGVYNIKAKTVRPLPIERLLKGGSAGKSHPNKKLKLIN